MNRCNAKSCDGLGWFGLALLMWFSSCVGDRVESNIKAHVTVEAERMTGECICE